MAAVDIPYNTPWVVARWAFRELFERLEDSLEREDDRYRARQAVALDGLSLGLLDEVTARRLALALASVAGELKVEVAAREQLDARDSEFVACLRELESKLSRVYS